MARIYMHINGYSGAGKTTLGQKLKLIFKNKIVITDLDDLLPNCDMNLSSSEEKIYMEHSINQYLSTVGNQIVILIGTACNETNIESYPAINAEHLIWYDVSLDEATKRALNRQIDWITNNREKFINKTKNMSLKESQDYLMHYYNYHQRIIDWAPLYEICEKLNYKKTSEDLIISSIHKKLAGL